MESIERAGSSRRHLPGFRALHDIRESFTATGRLVFAFFALMLIGSTAALLIMVSHEFLVTVPAKGGSLTEGEIGAPRFVNPLLAISDADRDLVMLTYSGLLKATADGGFIPDLAESYTISEDGLSYDFTIKEGAVFQDGTPVLADDVIYTVALAQDPAIKSPKRANWDGVLVEKISDREIRFTLKVAYAPFIANTTMGILPKHLWKDVSAEEFPFSSLNVEPIGSGPYQVTHLVRNAAGIPESYELTAFNDYTLGTPYISEITLRFYESEQQLVNALLGGEIDAASGITPSHLSKVDPSLVFNAPLNRVFGVFFNQNESEVLRNASVRRGLTLAIDKQALVNEILSGYGTPIDGPLPPGLLKVAPVATSTPVATTTSSSENARAYMESRGWKWSEDEHALVFQKDKNTTEVLAFELSTANIPELRAAAEYVRSAWEKMGARVEVKIFEQGDLNQNVIRPRKYDALLFGEVVGRELDLFAFWHSSQRNDPGLNIALYANAAADELLEVLRTASTEESRQETYQKFLAEITKDEPAVFLYSPDFTYVFPDNIEGLHLASVASPSERFLNVHEWHKEEDRVWSFLTRFVTR